MKQILGGVVCGTNSLGRYFFIHLETATKVESKIREKNQDCIYLIPDIITDADLERILEAGVSNATVKNLKSTAEMYEQKSCTDQLIDYDKNWKKGIFEIVYAIHKYYLPEVKRIECQRDIGNEVWHLIMQFSK